MAKDLPYFKFFCSEWNDGDITLEDYKIQGLFINVCSYYWSNECDISIEKLYKRFRHSKEEIDYLFKVELIHKIDAFLSVKFLDEQQEERLKTSKKNSEAGKASAERRRLAKLKRESNENPTSVEITLNENSTIKRREDKKRKDNTITDEKKFLSWFNTRRTHYLKQPSNVNLLGHKEKSNLKLLKRNYSIEDMEKAMYSFCNDDFYKSKRLILPTHFLEHDKFIKFLNDFKEEKTIGKKLAGL